MITNNFLSLKRGEIYGTAAQEIYDDCCKKFRWDRSKRGQFGRQQLLYAENSDYIGKQSVWFLAHSNWTGTNNGCWINRIWNDTIEEEYMDGYRPSTIDKTDRIVFAKTKNGKYMFLGVYKIESQTHNKRVYILISSQYPMLISN